MTGVFFSPLSFAQCEEPLPFLFFLLAASDINVFTPFLLSLLIHLSCVFLSFSLFSMYLESASSLLPRADARFPHCSFFFSKRRKTPSSPPPGNRVRHLFLSCSIRRTPNFFSSFEMVQHPLFLSSLSPSGV